MNPAVLSLHDVMPETFWQMEKILKYLEDHRIPPITLLVVPGRDWQPAQLERLHQLASKGYELAAHGWVHHVKNPRGLYHRVHSKILSRKVAEHLALDEAEIHRLMSDAHDWFQKNGLPAPSLYVPPAWALGRITRKALRDLPYEGIEVLRGIILPRSGKLLPLPMIGFEADNAIRARAVRTWNAWQLSRARIGGRPLRIGMHPNDLQLSLAESLRMLLTGPFIWQTYSEAISYVSDAIPTAT